MRKILVIGEHPANHSGFGNLNRLICSALLDSGKFDEVVSLGTSARKTNPHLENAAYVVINSNTYVQDQDRENIYGKLSLTKWIASNPTFTDVLCIGDPWYYESIHTIKSLFPAITFHYYCPVEGTKLPPIVYNMSQTINTRVDISDILASMDHIIAYSKTGMEAIRQLAPSKCNEYAYHWVEAPSQTKTASPLAEKLLGKFVIGFMGRNCHRKSIDGLLQLAEIFATNAEYNDMAILAHMPKYDAFGLDIDSVLSQLHPNTKDYIIFTEDIIPDIFINVDNGKRYRDIKNGAAQSLLESIYECMHVYISMSRSEGFGFPIAEAMVRNIPVVVNKFGTQAEIVSAACTSDIPLIPIAATEFYGNGNNAIMGIPNPVLFAKALLTLKTNEDIRKSIATEQYEFATRELLSSNSPHKQRIVESIYTNQKTITSTTNIAMITSPYERCGIRTYSNNLIAAINKTSNGKLVEEIPMISPKQLIEIAKYVQGRTIHIQYEAALWDIKHLVELVQTLHQNNKIIMTIHTKNDEAIAQLDPVCDHFIYHTGEQTDKISVMSHPFPEYNVAASRDSKRSELGFTPQDVVIGLNGFALPYKRLGEQATAILQLMAMYKNYPLRLFYVCAPHSNDTIGVGKRIIDSIKEYARTVTGNDDKISGVYKFMPSNEMAEYLSCMDVAICFHNNKAVGSQSGSVRELIAAGVIPIVTSSNNAVMHNDLIENKCAFGLKTAKDDEEMGPQTFARAACQLVIQMIQNGTYSKVIAEAKDNMAKYASTNSYSEAVKRHIQIYNQVAGGSK